MAVLSLPGVGPLFRGELRPLIRIEGMGRGPLLGAFEHLFRPGPSSARERGEGGRAVAELALSGTGETGGGGGFPGSPGGGPRLPQPGLGSSSPVASSQDQIIPPQLRELLEQLCPADRRIAMRLAREHAGAGAATVLRVLGRYIDRTLPRPIGGISQGHRSPGHQGSGHEGDDDDHAGPGKEKDHGQGHDKQNGHDKKDKHDKHDH